MAATPKKEVKRSELIFSRRERGNMMRQKKVTMEKTRSVSICSGDSDEEELEEEEDDGDVIDPAAHALVPLVSSCNHRRIVWSIPVSSSAGSRMSPTAMMYATAVPKQKIIMLTSTTKPMARPKMLTVRSS